MKPSCNFVHIYDTLVGRTSRIVLFYQAHEMKTNHFLLLSFLFFFLPIFYSFFLFSLFKLENMPTHHNTDLERNYHSIVAATTSRRGGGGGGRGVEHSTIVLQHQIMRHQRQRIILFAILVTISMVCVFISYLVSSVSKPTCSDRIIWIPNCNREEY